MNLKNDQKNYKEWTKLNNLLTTLFTQYNIVSNNTMLVDKLKDIKDNFSLNQDNIQLFFVGILYDFIKTQPQYYFNRNVENEVFNSLNTLFLKDQEKFYKAFFEQLKKFDIYWNINFINELSNR